MTPALPGPEMQQRFVTVRQESARKIPEMNKQAGEAFLAKNKGEKGVKTTASGLQYKVVTTGKGKQPTAEDTVTVNYRGTLIDGTEFDSSYKRNEPATFPVKGVIAGWTEALPLMKEGSKWMLYIPANLAYGERGAGNMIGPNSTLVFEVELLSIAKPAP
jgi:FKBP-type peptidyl-prolyl cis-trans isomerase FklB